MSSVFFQVTDERTPALNDAHGPWAQHNPSAPQQHVCQVSFPYGVFEHSERVLVRGGARHPAHLLDLLAADAQSSKQWLNTMVRFSLAEGTSRRHLVKTH